jgi:hypothetical protein
MFSALHGLRTELVFIDEYRGQFEALRNFDPERAEDILIHLRGTTESAVDLFNELLGLLLAGKSLDLSNPLPRDLRLTRYRDRPACDRAPKVDEVQTKPGAAD